LAAALGVDAEREGTAQGESAMASNYASTLVPAHWDKQKGVHQGPNGVAEALKALTRLHAAIDAKWFDTAALKSADEVQERLTVLDGVAARAVKAAVEQAKKTASLAKALEAELKKNKGSPKEALAAAGAVERDALAYAEQTASALQVAVAELKVRSAKLASREADSDKDDEVETGDIKLLRSRVAAALKAIKIAKPDDKPMLFVLGAGQRGCLPYLGYTAGASHKTILGRLMAGDSSIKYFAGECLWEANAFTFVGDNLPTGGFARLLKDALFDLTGVKHPVRVRRTNGEVDEDAEDEVDDAAAVLAALNTLTPAIKQAVAAQPARKEELLRPVAAIQAFVKAGNIAAAVQALRELKAAVTGAAVAKTGAVPKGLSPLKIWIAAKEQIGVGIGQLQQALRKTGEADSLLIADRGFHGITGRLQVGLQTALIEFDQADAAGLAAARARALAELAKFQRFVADDELVSLVDANPYGVPVRLKATLTPALDQVAQALRA
jgi:hypothetical protein